MFVKLLRQMMGSCTHRNVGWPLRKYQRCLDCGRVRLYDLEREIIGDWQEPERPEPFGLTNPEYSGRMKSRERRTINGIAPALHLV